MPKDAFDSGLYDCASSLLDLRVNGKQRAESTSEGVTALQQALEEKLADNGTARLGLKTTADDKIFS